MPQDAEATLVEGRSDVPPLWPHQRDALALLARRTAERAPRGAGTLLAVDMGGGKTRIAVEHMRTLTPDDAAPLTALILAPRSVLPIWSDQIQRWYGGGDPLLLLTHRGSTAKSAELLRSEMRAYEDRLKYDLDRRGVIFIVNYEALVGSPKLTPIIEHWAGRRAMRWRLLIADEAHRLKAPGSKTSRLLYRLKRRSGAHALALTGTPLPHSHLDAYGLMRFVDHTIFGSNFKDFTSRYTRRAVDRDEYFHPARIFRRGGGGEPEVLIPDNLDEFERLMAQATYRVAAADVLDLPESTDQIIPVELGSAARKAHLQLQEQLIADIRGGVVTAANAAVAVTRLQQIASGRAPTTDGVMRQVGEAKIDALRDLIAGIAEDEPLVVFCRFTADLAMIEELTEPRYRELSGRRNDLEEWQAGGGTIFGVQVQAGSVGIDLTRARYAVWFTHPFSLAQFEQARARLVRPGQHRAVHFYHLVAQSTIDEQIYRALLRRRQVIDEIVLRLQSG